MLIDTNTTTLATIGQPLRDLLAGISGVELKVLQDDGQRRGLHIGDARSDPDAHAFREGNHCWRVAYQHDRDEPGGLSLLLGHPAQIDPVERAFDPFTTRRVVTPQFKVGAPILTSKGR